MSFKNIFKENLKNIKELLSKAKLTKNHLESSDEYENLIKILCDSSFKCLTCKHLLRTINTNNFPEHFEICKSNTTNINSENDIWIFGYGSLIWKVDFPYETCHRGYICGYERRFYQNSLDHRGLPNCPGRVVTCIPSSADSRVYGIAYKISSKLKDEVLSHLDYREKNGYERCTLNFYHYPDSKKENFQVIMYIATSENESYAGHISNIKDIAEQIYWSWGPSGSNREYVYNLSASMKNLFGDVTDKHLLDLEIELKKRENFDEIILKTIQNRLHSELVGLIKSDKSEDLVLYEIDDLIVKLKRELYQSCN